MSNFDIINEIMTPSDLLSTLGYDVKRMMPCPILGHPGDNTGNFRINGNTWKCFSYDCGNGYSRDTVNLYTFIHFGNSFSNISTENKKNTLDYFKKYVKLNEYNQPINKLSTKLAEYELIAIADYFKGRKKISDIANGENKSRLFSQFILFHGLIKESQKKDYKKYKQQFLDYCKVDYFYDELRNYMNVSVQ